MNTTIIDNFKAFLQKQNYSKSTITGYIRAVQDLKDPPIEGSIRCSEVAKLMLSDINWSRGSIVIRKSKTYYERELPISKKLGEALEKYVIYYRPDSGVQLFFQSPRSGCRPVTTETIRSIMRRIFAKVGIDGWWVGTHTIRRSVGSRLHNAGNGLKPVSDLLGHKSINTSKAKLGACHCENYVNNP